MQRCYGDSVSIFKVDIRYGSVQVEVYSLFFQPVLERLDDAFILVVRGTGNAFRGFNPAEFKDHSVHVSAEFKQTAPFLEGEGSLPHIPEIGFEEVRRVSNQSSMGLVQFFFGSGQQVDQSHPICMVKAHAVDV